MDEHKISNHNPFFQLIVQVQFHTLNTEAHNNIEAVTNAMKQKHKAKSNRQKRFDFSDFDDATTEDVDTDGCSAGYITNPDNTCSKYYTLLALIWWDFTWVLATGSLRTHNYSRPNKATQIKAGHLVAQILSHILR